MVAGSDVVEPAVVIGFHGQSEGILARIALDDVVPYDVVDRHQLEHVLVSCIGVAAAVPAVGAVTGQHVPFDDVVAGVGLQGYQGSCGLVPDDDVVLDDVVVRRAAAGLPFQVNGAMDAADGDGVSFDQVVVRISPEVYGVVVACGLIDGAVGYPVVSGVGLNGYCRGPSCGRAVYDAVIDGYVVGRGEVHYGG